MRINEIENLQPFDTNDWSSLPSMYANYAKDPKYFNNTKNVEISVVNMDIDTYVRMASKMLSLSWGTETKSRLETGIDRVRNYANLMKSGEKFPMIYLDLIDNQQDGLHRAEAAKMLGLTKVPTLVISRYR